MKPLWLDFETYWSADFTLHDMTSIEYVLDPRFSSHGCAFVTADGSEWVDGPDLPMKFASIDWPNTMAISHNSLFDMVVLSFKYRCYPKLYGCTFSMARNWISHSSEKLSLAACSKYFGLSDKWETANKFKGMTLDMIKAQPDLYRELCGYGIDDALKCRDIFNIMLADGFPHRELRVIDWVVRMAAQPQLVLDQTLLAEHLTDVVNAKRELLEKAQLTDNTNIMSDQALAAMLLMPPCNLTSVPQKVSKKTGKVAYAFAKTDREFKALLDHPNPAVQTLVAARLSEKSTQEEKRCARLLSISRVTEKLPVPLKYAGAHTHRFSGDWQINLQNLGRKSRLRHAIKAPKGKKIVAVDASQIEARFNATLSGQWDLVEQFRAGEDVYASFAETIYQHPVNKIDHPVERFVGKTGILSLGYGSSAPVFQNMCRVQGDVNLNLSEATSIVFLYRQKYKEIVNNWYFAEREVLPVIAGLQEKPWRAWGPIGIDKFSLLLPSGNRLRYRDLHREYDTVNGKYNWQYLRGSNRPHFLYGAKTVENVIQALAFIHIVEVMLRVYDLTEGQLWPAHQIHDELLYVTDDHLAEMVRQLVVAEMAKPPEWMPQAPLAAEGKIGQSYGETK